MCNRKSRSAARLALAIAGGLVIHQVPTVHAALVTWNTTNGNWNTGANWTGNAGNPPGTTDNAQISNAGTYTVTLDTSPTIASFTLGSGSITLVTNGSPRTITSTGSIAKSTGTFTLGSSASTLLLTTSSVVQFSGGVTNILAGNDISGSSLLLGAGATDTMTVDGAGSTFTIANASTIGNSGTNGTLIFSSAAGGTMGALNLGAFGAGGSGTISVQSDADVTSSGIVALGTGNVANQSGSITVSGAGSTFIQSGTNTITLGTNTTSQGTITVSGGGAFTGGTGVLTVTSNGQIDVQASSTYTAGGNVQISTSTSGTGSLGKVTVGGAGAQFTQNVGQISVGSTTGPGALLQANAGGTISTGSGGAAAITSGLIDVNGGTLNVNGSIVLPGGSLQRSATGTLNWVSGKTMTISAGGHFTVLGDYALPTNATIAVTQGTVTQSSSGSLTVGSGSQINMSASIGNLLSALNLNVGTSGNGIITANGAGQQLALGGATVGGAGATGTITLSNGAVAGFGNGLNIATSGSGSVGTVTVQSGSNANGGNAVVIGGSNTTGTLTVTGSSSTVTQTGSATLNVGGGTANSGTLNVQSTGSYTTGTGLTTIASGGLINVDGGTLGLNGNMTVDGGTFKRTSTAGSTLSWPLSTGTLTVQNGGTASFAGATTFSAQTLHVAGASSLLNVSSGPLNMTGMSSITVDPGGHVNADAINLGSSPGVIAFLTVQGLGASATASNAASTSTWGTAGAQALAIFKDGAGGSFAGAIALGNDSSSANGSTLAVQNGSTLTANSLQIANSSTANVSASATVTGVNSTLNLNSSGIALDLGGFSGGSGTMNVLSGATLNVSNANGETNIRPTGILNITDATAFVGFLALQTGGALNFNSGILGFNNSFDINTGGILGSNVTLDSAHAVVVNNNTTIFPFHTLTLNGGSLSTQALINNGTFNFTSGTLNITGAGGLTIGTGGQLGATLNVSSGQTISVTNTTDVDSTGTLVIGDGHFIATGGVTNSGEIRFTGVAPRLTGGALTNSKLIRGDGRIDNDVTNASSGELRAESGKTLLLTGASGSNAGKINLQGGTIEFSQAITNGATGVVTGRGFFYADAGMTNNGQLQLSSGTTDFYGSLTGTSGSKVIVSGGGTATFYNPLAMQSGSEFRVSTASTAVFFGMVNGTNFFTGSGTKDFEGGSSALGPVITEGSTVVQPSATVNADNFRENALTVSGNVNITPDGTSAGTSKLVTLTINPGGKLDLSNNHLIVTSGSVGSWTGADYTGITGAIKSGRNNGAWNGSGIVTSQPLAISQITTLAVAAASDVNKTTFAGQPVNPSDVLVMYTYTGDANLDGKVNADDYFQIDSHINKFANSAKSWFNGDFNYDGQINGDDYFLIDNAYAGQGAPFSSGSLPGGVPSVPEPAATLSALVATAAIFTRRQRRC